MEEKRTFVEWVKCPQEFSKKFNYIKFEKYSEVYQYAGFSRRYKEKHEVKYKIILNFYRIFLDENNQLQKGYLKELSQGWYNNKDVTTHITEQAALTYLLNLKKGDKNKFKPQKKNWFNVSNWFS